MRWSPPSSLRVLLLLVLMTACVSPQGARSSTDAPFARDTGTQPPECQVAGIRNLGTGTRPDWSPDGRLIYYDSLVNGTFELHRMNADGTNRQCLTCNDRIPKVLQGKHKGVSTMSPGGQYVVFFAENEHGGHRWMNTPGLGDDNDFWAMDADAKNFWRLTSNPAGSAIQFPKFSFDGKTFIWSERLEKGRPLRKGHEYGVWKIRMADFLVTPAGPRFGKIVDLEPAGKGYYEPHGLTPDGKKMLFTAMVNPNKSQYYGELYSYDLASRQLINLAKADDLHFEMAIATPGGSKISFMSGPFIGMLRFFYKTDLYLMDADGLNRVRLTYFNEVGHPESTGEDTLMNKHAWKPDGTAIAGAYYIHKTKEISLFLLTFQGACGKR